MEVMIKLKINEKIEEYRKDTGATKTWISHKLGMSKQRLSNIGNGDNITLKLLLRVAIFLNCKTEDLYEYSIVDDNIQS